MVYGNALVTHNAIFHSNRVTSNLYGSRKINQIDEDSSAMSSIKTNGFPLINAPSGFFRDLILDLLNALIHHPLTVD